VRNLTANGGDGARRIRHYSWGSFAAVRAEVSAGGANRETFTVLFLHGLQAYGLTQSGLIRLGETKVRIYVDLGTDQITPALLRRRPPERRAYLAGRARRRCAALLRAWPAAEHQVHGSPEHPKAIEGTVPARAIRRLAQVRGASWLAVLHVAGLRRKRVRVTSLERWFTVRANVAIQIEGQRRGMQTWEERFVTVKASSFDDAIRRLVPFWERYAQPSLNPEGELVRWQLEEVVDVYEMSDPSLDPSGTEVFSALHSRRIQPHQQWHPRRHEGRAVKRRLA
jgi:hypothetical protein